MCLPRSVLQHYWCQWSQKQKGPVKVSPPCALIFARMIFTEWIDFFSLNFALLYFFFKSSDRRMMRKQSKPDNPEYRMKYINVHRTIYFFFILMSCFILSKQLFIQQKYHECKIITLSDNYFEWPQRRTSEVYKNNVKWPIH